MQAAPASEVVKETPDSLREAGNKAFKAGDHDAASILYSRAIKALRFNNGADTSSTHLIFYLILSYPQISYP